MRHERSSEIPSTVTQLSPRVVSFSDTQIYLDLRLKGVKICLLPLSITVPVVRVNESEVYPDPSARCGSVVGEGLVA